ncbi:MAG: glycosyltransferase [Mucilaginibacter sp.]|nr:glycosyltransferase [Mucilaginibacter sp.]
MVSANINRSGPHLFSSAPGKELQITVILPVKNEEEGLIRTLEALRLQLDNFNQPLNLDVYEILLLANNCTDESALLARTYQSAFPEFRLHVVEIQLERKEAHIGTVRRILMDEAFDRLNSVGRPRGIIVPTDGDSEVDPHWLHYIMEEMNKGNDVVGGRILPRETPALSKIHHLRDVSYRFHLSRLESMLDPCGSDPWPRHFQCYGPSLAVTCEIYEKAGRIPAIPYLEDEEFRKALYRIDAKVRKSPKVKVYTSSRLVGKVEFGFSV